MVAIKKQLPKFYDPYQWNYKNSPGRNNEGKLPQLTRPSPRLQIEVALKRGNICVFHLTTNHDSDNFLETTRMMQLLSTNELNATTPSSEPDSYLNGDSGNLFLEYKSNFESSGECYETIDETSYIVLT